MYKLHSINYKAARLGHSAYLGNTTYLRPAALLGVLQGSQVLADLSAATLCMLSQRAPAHEPMVNAGAIPVLLHLLDPQQSIIAVDNAAKALGNLSADAACRSLMRSSGAVGALVRLLKPDCLESMQVSAAASLALLAARDSVVQDSLRYLGAIPLLVDLLASPSASVTEAARCCLSALKRNNTRNAADILASLRSSPDLAKDYWRLKGAITLLDETPSHSLAGSLTSSPLANNSMSSSLTASPAKSTRSRSAARVKATVRDLLLEQACTQARREAAEAAAQVASAVEEEVLRRRVRRAQQPLAVLHTDLDGSLALLKASLADSKAARKAAATLAAYSSSNSSRPSTAPSLQRPTYSRNSEAPAKSTVAKHLLSYSNNEVVALLHEAGFDTSDTRAIKRAGLSGAELLLLDEPQLFAVLGLPKHKARRLKRLQDAMRLYDTIATCVAQGRLTDLELRLWLASQGCGRPETSRVMKLLRSLVMNDPDAPFITAWEWVVGWTWVMHALEVYGVDWRV
eukprot:GHRR01012740.1.p1 GENE.GHRR01012740.1~~GHRR01012740.1.p1  ORF type:complete len:515 (+),score=197.13 GHRR01012740.1:1110-2654(+)